MEYNLIIVQNNSLALIAEWAELEDVFNKRRVFAIFFQALGSADDLNFFK